MKQPVKWWVFPLTGFILTAIGSGAFFYFLIRPQGEEIKKLQEQIREKEAIIAQRQQAEADLRQAKLEAQQTKKRWRQVGKYISIMSLPDTDKPVQIWETGIAFQQETLGFFERDLRKYLAELANRFNLELRYQGVPEFRQLNLQMPTPQPNGYFRWGQMNLQLDGRFADILRFLEGLPFFTRPIVVQSPQFQLLPNGKVRCAVPIEIYALVETPVERAILEGKSLSLPPLPTTVGQQATQPQNQPMGVPMPSAPMPMGKGGIIGP